MYKKILSISLLLLLIGCGPDPDPKPVINSDSGNNGQDINQDISQNTNKVELGPVVGATVTITTLDGKHKLLTTTTNEKGYYTIDKDLLKANLENLKPIPKYLFVTAKGGEDIDPEDDGDTTNSSSISVNGVVKGVFKTSTLLNESDISVNLLTTAVSELLGGKGKINDEQIKHIVKKLGIPDINGDGKINNEDIYEYSMSENESKLEDELRKKYLAYIHNGDVNKLENATQEMREKYNLMLVNYTIKNSIAYLNIEKTNSSNKILYALNPKKDDTLNTIYNSSITLKSGEYVAYKECNQNKCFTTQIASFDGEKLYQSFFMKSNFSIFSDIHYMNSLRNQLIKKSKSLHTIESTISSQSYKIKNLEKDIDSLNSAIDEVKNEVKDEIL